MLSMFKRLCLIALFSYVPLIWAASTSPTPNGEKNYSGSYSCKGNNSKVGDYAYTLTLKLNKSHSHDEVNVYELTGETENSTLYSGNGVAIANRMSMAFRVSDHKDNVFGSGFAVFKAGPEKLWSFTTHYYEPNDTGGASGTDVCTQNPPITPKKPVEEASQKKPADDAAPKKSVDDALSKKSADDSATKRPLEETKKSEEIRKSVEEAPARKAPEDNTSKKPADEPS